MLCCARLLRTLHFLRNKSRYFIIRSLVLHESEVHIFFTLKYVVFLLVSISLSVISICVRACCDELSFEVIIWIIVCSSRSSGFNLMSKTETVILVLALRNRISLNCCTRMNRRKIHQWITFLSESQLLNCVSEYECWQRCDCNINVPCGES